jgi:hypothetical protein
MIPGLLDFRKIIEVGIQMKVEKKNDDFGTSRIRYM